MPRHGGCDVARHFQSAHQQVLRAKTPKRAHSGSKAVGVIHVYCRGLRLQGYHLQHPNLMCLVLVCALTSVVMLITGSSSPSMPRHACITCSCFA